MLHKEPLNLIFQVQMGDKKDVCKKTKQKIVYFKIWSGRHHHYQQQQQQDEKCGQSCQTRNWNFNLYTRSHEQLHCQHHCCLSSAGTCCLRKNIQLMRFLFIYFFIPPMSQSSYRGRHCSRFLSATGAPRQHRHVCFLQMCGDRSDNSCSKLPAWHQEWKFLRLFLFQPFIHPSRTW